MLCREQLLGISVTFAPSNLVQGILRQVWSADLLPEAVQSQCKRADGASGTSLTRVLVEAAALQALHEPTPVAVRNMRQAPGHSDRTLHVSSLTYGAHLRPGDVEVRIVAPSRESRPGMPDESFSISGHVLNVQGRLALVELDPISQGAVSMSAWARGKMATPVLRVVGLPDAGTTPVHGPAAGRRPSLSGQPCNRHR